MIKLMYIKTLEVAGFAPAFKGMRNPLDSWGLSDSYADIDDGFIMGEKDLDLAQRLIKAGNEHCKFLRQIQVWADINVPRYMWQELDTYKFGTKNSCSTMHTLMKNPITLDMFVYDEDNREILSQIVDYLNGIRNIYLTSKKAAEHGKSIRCLLLAKQILPEGFLQLRTWNTNYAELRNIWTQRRHHKLKEEWQELFTRWIKSLPYSKELITYGIED